MTAKRTTLHLITPEDIVRSVLKGHKVTVQCGQVRKYTREEVDAVPALIESGDVRYCTECHRSLQTLDTDINLIRNRGWLATLEYVWLPVSYTHLRAHET